MPWTNQAPPLAPRCSQARAGTAVQGARAVPQVFAAGGAAAGSSDGETGVVGRGQQGLPPHRERSWPGRLNDDALADALDDALPDRIPAPENRPTFFSPWGVPAHAARPEQQQNRLI